jgi:hypothetical protein
MLTSPAHEFTCANGVSTLGDIGHSDERVRCGVPHMQGSAVFLVLNDDHRAARPGHD